MIESTRGLRVIETERGFDDIGGHDHLREFIESIFNGRRRPGGIVFVDEIEKMLAGNKTDSSGTTQDALGWLLTYMQTSGATGIILVGPPGVGKSAIAQAAGNYGNCPTIALDLGETKGSLVGQSQQQIRACTRVLTLCALAGLYGSQPVIT